MTRESACHRADGLTKLGFDNKAVAKAAARRAQARLSTSEMHVYRCPDCRYFHIAHRRRIA